MMDITAVCISEKGTKVTPLLSYTSTHSNNSHGASWQVSKAEYDAARELCDHAGFVPGSLWKRKTNGVTMRVVRIKEFNEHISRLGCNNKDPDSILILQCCNASTENTAGTGYAICELEPLE